MNRRPRVIRTKGVIASAKAQRKPPTGKRLEFRVDPWTRRLIRPVLIALLATSVSIALLAIVRIGTPDLAWMVLAPLCFFAALEGAYTSAWLNNPDSFGVDRGVYRITEILLLIVVARIYSWVLFGGGIPSPEEMRTYLTSPSAVIYVGSFLTTAFVTLIAWWIAVSIGRTFTKLDVSIYEVGFYTLSQNEQKALAEDRPIQIQREELFNSYLRTWISIGMVMVILAALSTYEVDELTTVTNPFEITRLGLSSAMLLALITYFLAGLWLLSHARLLRMNARWLIDGVAMDPTLERGWQRSAILVVLGVALLAAFLPIGSSLAISRILSLGLAGVAYLLGLIVQFIGYAIAATILLLTGNMEEEAAESPVIIPTPVPQAAPPPPPTPNPFIEMVITSAFWALLVAIIIAATLYFLRERGYRIEGKRIQAQWQIFREWLQGWWLVLTRRLRLTGRNLRLRLQSSNITTQIKADPSIQRPRFLRLNALSPREQVRYYYLALVRRASEHGVRRDVGETPLEYIQDLKNKWPDAEDDLEDVTRAFLEARYSPQPIETSDANSIKQRWRRLKSHLRGRK